MPANPLYTVPLRITQVFDQRIPTKRRAVVIKQGQTATIKMNLLDDLGNTIDLEPYDVPLSEPTQQLRARFSESIANDSALVYDEQTGEIEDPDTGLISFPVPEDLPQCGGVYFTEVGLFDAEERMFFSNTLSIIVERGLFFVVNAPTPYSQYPGPPTLDEIRMSMRDNGPEDNRLLDDYEFDAAELAWAMVRSVQFWNTTPPPIEWFFNTVSFPFRDLWLDGICGQLFEMAANRYMRNDLQYSAGGLTVADQAKWQQYQVAGEKRWGFFTNVVKSKKVQLNMDAALGSLSSPYGWGRNY